MTRPRRPLSNSASTASCSMRFSLRTMMSGARSSIRRFRRLLRLITRRYRSLRSDVAKRPPSSGTSGRSSGGMTGTTSRIIHSGRLPDSMKLSTTFEALDDLLGLELRLGDSELFVRSAFCSPSRSRFDEHVLIASAPMPAENASSPYSSCASSSSSSVRSWKTSRAACRPRLGDDVALEIVAAARARAASAACRAAGRCATA